MRPSHKFLAAMFLLVAADVAVATTSNVGILNDFRSCGERFTGIEGAATSKRETLCLDGGAQAGISGTILAVALGMGTLGAAGISAVRKNPSP